jgi:hypothetical protein
VGKIVEHDVRKKWTKRGAVPFSTDSMAEASARFDRLLEAMAKTPPLPNKRKRVVERQVPNEFFDD